MKYQIQQYKEEDHSNRSVIAKASELSTQDELKDWFAKVSSDTKLNEGNKLVLVAENHPWFIVEDSEPTDGPNNVVSADPVNREKATGFEGPNASFSDVARFEKNADKKRRKQKFERQQAFEKHMADFEG